MVFGKFVVTQEQAEEILDQFKGTGKEMENCLTDKEAVCYELFRVSEGKNIEILYWVRIVKLDDDSYELQFLRELQPTW